MKRHKKTKIIYGVYTHAKPCGTIFYVGKGPKNRSTWFSRRNKWHTRIINKYGAKNIIVKWVKSKSEAEALKQEKILIAYYKSNGFILVNLTDGGEGVSGYKHLKKDCKKISRILKIKLNEEINKQKRSLITKEMWTRPSYRRKIIAVRKGIPTSKDQKRKQSKSMKIYWKKKKLAFKKGLINRLVTPPTKKTLLAQSKASKKMWKNPKYRKTIIAAIKKRMQNVDKKTRKRMSKTSKLNWKTPQIRDKMIRGIVKSWERKSCRQKHVKSASKASKLLWKIPNYRRKRKIALRKAHSKKSYKLLRSEISKNLWKDPNFRNKLIKIQRIATTKSWRNRVIRQKRTAGLRRSGKQRRLNK